MICIAAITSSVFHGTIEISLSSGAGFRNCDHSLLSHTACPWPSSCGHSSVDGWLFFLNSHSMKGKNKAKCVVCFYLIFPEVRKEYLTVSGGLGLTQDEMHKNSLASDWTSLWPRDANSGTHGGGQGPQAGELWPTGEHRSQLKETQNRQQGLLYGPSMARFSHFSR